MDYLYINAIVKETYRDLPCGCPFPDSYKGAVLKASAGDAFLKDPSISSVISYYSLKSPNRVPVLVLSNVEKHTNSASVGRFTQCMGWEWDGRMALEDLDSIFQAAFYSEQEINDMALQRVTIPLPRSARRNLEPLSLSIVPAAKQAILTAVMTRWLRHQPAIRIAVPNGVDYNRYVLNAVKQIYSFFPVGLRAEAGFCSYLPSNPKEANSRIYIGFIPESMADSATIFLNGSSRAAISSICADGTTRSTLDHFIKYLSVISPEQCQGFLTELYADVEHHGDGIALTELTGTDYSPTGECLTLLSSDGTAEQMLPKWKTFCKNLDRYPNRMRGRVQEKIRRSLVPDEVCRLFLTKIQGLSDTGAVLRELEEYAPLCSCSTSLADTLWSAVVEHLRSQGVSYHDISQAVTDKKAALFPIADSTRLGNLQILSISEQFDAVKTLPTETLPNVKDAIDRTQSLLAALNAAPPSDASAALNDRIQETLNLLNGKHAKLILAGYSQKYQSILELPDKSLSEINELIHRSKELLASMEAVETVPGIAELKTALQKLIREKQETLNSSDVRFRQMLQKLSGDPTYFDMLETVNADRDIQLNPIQREQLENTLSSKKPTTITAYEEGFRSHYGKKLTLSAVSKLPDYVCHRIVLDICLFNRLVVPFSKRKKESPEEFSRRISGNTYVAERISDTCSVDVLFNNHTRNGAWFNQLITLSHTRDTMGTQRDFEEDFYALVDYGIYSGEDMIRSVEMLHNCSMKFTPLFERILMGKFHNCTPNQYSKAYQLIAQYSPNKKTLPEMQRLAKSMAETDSTAAKAFETFAKKHGSGSGKKVKLIIGIVSGVLVLGIVAAVLFLLLRKSPEPPKETRPTATQATTPTEAPKVQYPPVFHNFAQAQPALNRLFTDAKVKDFSVFKDPVTKLLTQTNEVAKQQIIEFYAAGAAESENSDLDWNAYFFWKCWLLASSESEIPEDAFADARNEIAAPDPEAVAIVRFLQQRVPVAEETEDPAQDAQTQQDQQVAASMEATSEPAENTAEVTVETEATAPALPTMEEIVASICDAAAVPYDAATAGLNDLLPIVELFGANLNKPFNEQEALVKQLLSSSEANANQLRLHYQTLPGSSIIRFADDGISVTWDEFVFWQYWLLSREEGVVITADSFTDELNAQVLSILRILYTLPDVELPDAVEQPQATNTSEGDVISNGSAADATAPSAQPETDFNAVYAAAQPAFEHAEAVYNTVVGLILAD